MAPAMYLDNILLLMDCPPMSHTCSNVVQPGLPQRQCKHKHHHRHRV